MKQHEKAAWPFLTLALAVGVVVWVMHDLLRPGATVANDPPVIYQTWCPPPAMRAAADQLDSEPGLVVTEAGAIVSEVPLSIRPAGWAGCESEGEVTP